MNKRVGLLLAAVCLMLICCGPVTNTFAAENFGAAAPLVTFGADNAPIETVTLGSVDPESGFEFELELTSKGAAITRATFSGFDDRDHKDPQPLQILSPIKFYDGSEILSMANRQFPFTERQL